MAVRTTPEKVRGIIVGIEDDFELGPLIETANMVVTAICQAAYTAHDPTNAPAQLVIIETWLTAHLWSCDNSRLSSEMIGRGRDMIEGKVDLGLDLTHHGQQLRGIDFLGTLADFGKNRRKVKVTWLGIHRSETDRRWGRWGW